MAKQNRWFFALMAVLVVASCLSIPVMAEKMLERGVDQVMTDGEQVMSSEESAKREEMAKQAYDSTPQSLVGHKLSQNAQEALVQKGRASYFEVFAQQIPDSYQTFGSDAYEEDGVMGYVLSMMPENWESSTETLSEQERMPFYTIQFKDVDIELGTGEIIGMQRFWLNNDAFDVVEANYTEAQLTDMETAARSFSEAIGLQPGGLIATDKVAGGYDPGCIFEFALSDGKTVSVTVAADTNEITGYSMVRGKG